MNKLKRIFFVLFFFCSSMFANATIDTTQILNNIKKINELFETKVDSCKSLILQNIESSKKIKFDKGTAKSYLLLTQYYMLKGIPDSAKAVIPDLEKAAKKCSDKNLNVSILLKISLIYSEMGDFGNAIKKAIEAQRIAEDIKNYRLLAKVNHDLGFIYSNKQLYKNALSYFKKGLEYAFLAKDTFSIANMYARIGGVFNESNIPDSGLYYNSISLKYFQIIKMQRGIGVTYNNIAGSYELMKNYSKAIEYYMKALAIREQLGDEAGITIINYNLGVSYLHIKKYDLAEKYLLNSLERNKAQKDYPQILETLKQLCVLHSENNTLNSYKQFADEYMTLKDSISSAENIKAIGELQEKYQSEKKEKNILMLKKENEKQEEVAKSERKNKLVIIISSLLLILMMSIFGLILYNRYKIMQKQKNIIEKQKEKVELQKQITEHQKNLLEEKQKEIVDSINYAKRLQDAILPPIKYVKEHFPHSFILYKPKDIVAGDFYWFEKTKGRILFAAADCTGHGVPGALVSVVCSNALNRTVKEFGITDPGRILDKVRELVIETFEKSESEVKDGMDISLCSFNPQTRELKWSGANNPLWILRGRDFIEYKPNKQSIGKNEIPFPFITHTIQLFPDDRIYIFTDGYADQFGGEKGKKFKYSKLKELLILNNSQNITEQLHEIDDRLEKWKGNLEQVDDILVIGIAIS